MKHKTFSLISVLLYNSKLSAKCSAIPAMLMILISLLAFRMNCTGQSGVFKGSPVINGPSVIGNYPNTPFLYAVPTSGERPVKWSAESLPPGLKLNPKTGIIQGSIINPGTYKMKIKAKNKLGECTKTISIKIGDTLCLTPPMGWSSWNSFDKRISDALIRQVADSMVASGMKELGYQYINIDDGWHMNTRDKNGRIQENREIFPYGLKALADYIHSKGLKLGIYSSASALTCLQKPGSNNFENEDARFYAESGVDLLKYDYCGAPEIQDTAIARYSRMAKALRKTNRSIVFSVCEWGYLQPWKWAKSAGGNYWRTTGDICNFWDQKIFDEDNREQHEMLQREFGIDVMNYPSIMMVLDKNAILDEHAGPGHWNDPDMMVAGIYDNTKSVTYVEGSIAPTDEEYQSQMSLWCLMASPLICGNDIRNMNKATKKILLNPEIIEINQDPLGKQAKRIRDDGDTEVFVKPMADGSLAIGLLNRSAKAQKIAVSKKELGIHGAWKARNVWTHADSDFSAGVFEVLVESHQTVVIRIKPE